MTGSETSRSTFGGGVASWTVSRAVCNRSARSSCQSHSAMALLAILGAVGLGAIAGGGGGDNGSGQGGAGSPSPAGPPVTPTTPTLTGNAAPGASTNERAPTLTGVAPAGTTVTIRDGATIIMGGLVQDSASTTRRKVPILGDLPLIGKAFTGKYENSERTELVFFLTPRIIRDAATEESVKTTVK